ncbi:MAG: polysaccharide deacetylase family protein [Candidatus Dormiibacterota bacterium]
MDSELLGFASDARVLILNCDDLGMHEAVNAAIVDAIENGVATSCSLMASCPGAADAIALLRERPHVPFGLHLTLIRDNPGYVWGPSSPKAEVPSLLDPNTGELFTDEPVNRDRLLAQARLEDVERELRAQLNTVADAGLTPTHLDWHCLADGGRADIFDLGLMLAEEYGLAARVWLDDGRQKVRALGKPVVDHAFLDSFTVDVDSKPETYERLLRALQPGLSEWAVHPALGTEDWQAIEPSGWRVRQSDHAFLTSDRAREVIAEEHILVIDYTLLQNAWRSLSDTTA